MMTTFQDIYWRYMLQFESVALVKRIFNKIHKRTLNTTRAKQIVAAYLQGKEYYRNASQANISVKPLLLFYGISSLSRCLTLLLNSKGGEETLSQGHGLNCNGWSTTLTTNLENGLKNIGNLSLESCNGLFKDLLNATNNLSCLHTISSGVDRVHTFPMPSHPIDLTFSEIVERLPDIEKEYTLWAEKSPLVARVINYKLEKKEFTITLRKQDNIKEIVDYAAGRIKVSEKNDHPVLNVEVDDLPLLLNSFVEKGFDKIPHFYIAKPFPKNTYIAQIHLTFILSYFLGMLCRYFPSHWMALSRGNIGDEVWPLIQSSITYIEKSFPQLITEFIQEKSDK